MGNGTRRLRRAVDRGFDWLSTRPLSVLVFLASVLLLVFLQSRSAGLLKVRAVGHARAVEHPALVSSFVSTVYVKAGDYVKVGAPLVDISPYFIERELKQLNAEIEQVLHESRLAQAQLLVEEERWLKPSLRLQPNRPSVETPTEQLYAARLSVLQTRRSLVLEARDKLTVASKSTGRVALVMEPGSSVALGTSVAAVTPEYAQEIIAYAPPDTHPDGIEAGAPVRIVQPRVACDDATVLRRGAAVEEAPGQLRDFLRLPVHGMPVYISVPVGCELGVGQVLSVEFPKAHM